MLFSTVSFSQSLNFSIVGNIKGLERGDTLRFQRISLPNWDRNVDFEIVAAEDNRFEYRGSHPHTQMYTMTYHPVGKELPHSEKGALLLLIREGETQINGERDWIYISNKISDIYDTELRTIEALEDSLSRERSLLLQKAYEYRNEGDTAAAKIAVEQFNNFHRHHSDYLKQINTMRQHYTDSVGNEYAACELCQQTSIGLQDLEKGYARLTSEAKESYYGKLLSSIIEKIRSLETGQIAPEFKLTTLKGANITNADFKGKYLLIYHFGLCPGSMQAESHVRKLYETHSDIVEIIGLTESIASLQQIAANIKDGETLMGMNLKPIMISMTNHPWKHEVETVGDNKAIREIFNIQGLPFFICISPEGKIVSRGYFEAFEQAKKIVEQENIRQ